MRFLKLKLLLIASLALALSASAVSAQDETDEQPEAASDAIVTQESTEEKAEDLAKSDDPADQIAAYFIAMGDLVNQNIETPDILLTKFKAYIDANEVSMRNAAKEFQRQLRRLKVDEAELYRETTQRKITPALEKLLANLIQLADRHPESAKKLDSMLKIDAKYTYQP